MSGYDYEIELTVTDNSEVTVKELNGGIESQSVYLVHRNHIDHCNQLGVTMIEDIETLLTERIKSRGFGALGAAEFELILERIDFHMSWLRKVYEKRHSNNRRNDFLS